MGRPKQASFSQVTVHLNDGDAIQLLGPNPRRVGVVLSPHKESAYAAGWAPSDQGTIDFYPFRFTSINASPIVLCCCDFGTILQMPLWGCGTENMDVTVGEILSDNPDDWMTNGH